MSGDLVVFASTDSDYALLFSHILEREGFRIALARGATEVVHLAAQDGVRAVLLDCHWGDMLALEACLALKKSAVTAGLKTIALIGPGAEERIIDLLNAGIDESFVRPLPPARVISYLISDIEQTSQTPIGKVLRTGDIELHFRDHSIHRNGIQRRLGFLEFKLLLFLMQQRGRICTQEQLVEAGWKRGQFVERKTLIVHISRLRKLLVELGATDLIHTVRYTGYVFGQFKPKPNNEPGLKTSEAENAGSGD